MVSREGSRPLGGESRGERRTRVLVLEMFLKQYLQKKTMATPRKQKPATAMVKNIKVDGVISDRDGSVGGGETLEFSALISV